MTKYILKHRNRDVAFFAMDEDGDLYSLEIASPEYMPILGNGPKNLAEWIQNRAIPEDVRICQESCWKQVAKPRWSICYRIWRSARQILTGSVRRA